MSGSILMYMKVLDRWSKGETNSIIIANDAINHLNFAVSFMSVTVGNYGCVTVFGYVNIAT